MSASLGHRIKTREFRQAMLSSLRHLPRDARDTLFLLGVIAWVLLPQFERLPWWGSLLTGSLLVWRGVVAWKGLRLPSRWWLRGLLILCIAGAWSSHETLLGRDAGVTLITLLLALKTLELRAQRDAFVIFFLGFFSVLSNFFFSQSLTTAVAMVIALWGLLTALINSQLPVDRPPLLFAARTAGRLILAGAPVMLALFLLFPRITPLWGLPSDSSEGRSGLTGLMRVGDLAQLALDDNIAMRIRFDNAAPSQEGLYFRGPVLSSFDGRQWRPLRSAFPAQAQLKPELKVSGPPTSYQVTLSASNRPWLVVLDATPQAPDVRSFHPTMGSDLQWQTDQPIAGMIQFRANSYLSFQHGPLQAAVGLQDFVDLPPGYNPRTLQLAADMRRKPDLANAGPQVLVDAVLDKLRTGGYEYTLEPGVYGTHTADEFWFDRKAGFCEHIASSFVLLMRALDVPARIVTGYQGGQMNSADGMWTVRQSDAHAWVEVWMANRGWVRVDPTAAVAPSRIGSTQRLQRQPNPFTKAADTLSPGLSAQLRAFWEATNSRWNQWILQYNQSKQMDLLRNMGFSAPELQDLSAVLLGLIASISLAGAGWMWWSRQAQDPWLRLLHRAARELRHQGIPVPTNATPRSIANLLLAQDDADTNIVGWLLRMEAWRYGRPTMHHGVSPTDSETRRAIRQLRRELRQLRWKRV
jgi:transglutaminase-like putative cysteine protease